MEEVNLAEVHGHVFMLVGDHRFTTYEYAEGKARDLSHISIDFFGELAEHVRSISLGETIGFQIRGLVMEKIVELDLRLRDSHVEGSREMSWNRVSDYGMDLRL